MLPTNPPTNEQVPDSPAAIEKVKLTKAAISNFLEWSTSRYNKYLNFGNKQENVNRIFFALQAGCYMGWTGERKEADKTTFMIECAGAVGEGYNGHGYSRSRWKTKTGSKNYVVDCVNCTIREQNSGREIHFLPVQKR